MNILWFCEDFYPCGGVGFVRIANLIRAQQERGNQIAVVYTNNNLFPNDYGLWRRLHMNEIKLIETPVTAAYPLSRADKFAALFRYAPHRSVYPWSTIALYHATNSIPSGWVDVVCASGPQWGGVLAAWDYSRQFSCPLLVDYRDPFLGPNPNAITYAGRLLNRRIMALEKGWLRHAKLVTVITADFQWSKNRLRHLATNLVSLSNGFNVSLPEQRPPEFNQYEVNLVFTGTIRDAFMFRFLDEFAAAISEMLPGKKCCLWVLGRNASGLSAENARFIYMGFKPHLVVECYQQHADLLVHVLGPEVESRYDALSGKVWEYIGKSAPILCVVPPSSTAGHFVETEMRGRATNGYSLKDAAILALKLLDDREIYLGNRDALEQRYSWSSIRNMYWKHILDAVAGSI